MDYKPAPLSYTENTEPSSQGLRKLVQFGFLALNIWIGFLFFRFAAQLLAGIEPTVTRPSGVEGYLPLSALISIKHWIANGEWNTVHPAAVVLLLTFITTALLLKKGFCSWFCPIGLFSEYLAKLRTFIFRKPFGGINKWVDWPLRMVKYLLAGAFIQAIFYGYNAEKAAGFVYGDYNKVADLKLGLFFTNLSTTSIVVLITLTILSILYPYFWCRYLCPYGGLLGLFSIFSPVTVQRNTDSCIDCQACTAACPAILPVHKMTQVSSDECHACLKCVDVCPVQDTLQLKLTVVQKKVSGKVFAAVIVGFFLLATGAAQLYGYWETSTTPAQYLELMPEIDQLSHDRSF